MSLLRKTALVSALMVPYCNLYAAPAQHYIVAPHCLTAQASITNTIASNKTLDLFKASSGDIEKLNEVKHVSSKPCGGFVNVTKAWQHNTKSAADFLSDYSKPARKSRMHHSYTIKYQKKVHALLNQLNPDLMWNNLGTFSSSRDRYADSDLGVAAANWLKVQVQSYADAAHRDDVSMRFVDTYRYQQPSLVVKVGKGNGPGIVIGAHMDTTSSAWSRKPGADDDGSGSMTVLETARTIIASGTTFKKPIYFIWYAAEEEGLVGSDDVVKNFQDNKTGVEAVLHFDMTGYAHHNEPTIWLMDDNTNAELNTFMEQLIKTYTAQPVKYTRCGYGCSDHASWDREGFPATIAAEARFEDTNPVMHSSNDTMDKLSLAHMTDYAKIATAFAVELAEPQQ